MSAASHASAPLPAAAPVVAASTPHQHMANAIRALAMDAVEQAQSGHPGMPMGMADVATVLFTRFLKYDPHHPNWPDRDRFVLSAGHGSMLLYALLHLTGYADMPMEELKRFRQLGSRTAGHPEREAAGGIETTTGPLGQGLGNAVGMALAERLLAERFGSALVDHRTYVIAGDGCLMEGISHEAISLAGHLGLNRLIVLWDDNRISIDGPTDLSVSDDQVARFAACGWATRAIDGHDPAAIETALEWAQGNDRPSLIACRTTIGYGAPKKAGTAASHGAPLGADEIAQTRTRIGWSHAPFVVPDDILSMWRQAGARGAGAYRAWSERHAKADATARGEFDRVMSGRLPDRFAQAIDDLKRALATEKPKLATRQSSQRAIEAIAPVMPELVGGSADLTGSNNTKGKGQAVVARGKFAGHYLHFGVREHGMVAALNGMALHGGVVPYGGTFLVFTDYCRPSIRLAALMHQRVILVMTHDSIGLGEDGPTHQPIEHLAALRAIPNLQVFRPADSVETAECWALALATADGPSVIALTRQSLPAVRLMHTADNLCARGGYVLAEADGKRQATLISTGSEVAIALDAQAKLKSHGIAAAVVSVPSHELFLKQPAAYRQQVLGAPGMLRVAIEAGVAMGWERMIGADGLFVGLSGFGASAPYADLYKHFGLTAEAVVAAVTQKIARGA
ncbi:MAG: transketolase [Alphaproteobacteria bacterium]|nr:transketolase [Alphaproteobacteria bacterium]